MKVVFVSNYLNHHQLPFCLAMSQKQGIEFTFIATTRIPKFRLNLGYEDLNTKYDFVLPAYKSKSNKENFNKALSLCEEADVVINGGAPGLLVKKRIEEKKLTFIASERVFKKDPKFWEWPLRTAKYFWTFARHRSLYLLCSGAFVSRDYAINGAFINKAYKWGYFPETKKYTNINDIMSKKEKNSILWVARLIELKHPEEPLEVAKKLKENGYDFTLNIIGEGNMLPQIIRYICENNLEGNVNILDSMSPAEVRNHMEKSKIFLFTSDRNEGWGAVLNEAMNSACAVVSGNVIGGTHFLIKDGENGLIYQSGNVDNLYEKTVSLIKDSEHCQKIGEKAYETIVSQWNAQNAADRFLELSLEMLKGNKKPNLFKDGVLSKAEYFRC